MYPVCQVKVRVGRPRRQLTADARRLRAGLEEEPSRQSERSVSEPASLSRPKRSLDWPRFLVSTEAAVHPQLGRP